MIGVLLKNTQWIGVLIALSKLRCKGKQGRRITKQREAKKKKIIWGRRIYLFKERLFFGLRFFFSHRPWTAGSQSENQDENSRAAKLRHFTHNHQWQCCDGANCLCGGFSSIINYNLNKQNNQLMPAKLISGSRT